MPRSNVPARTHSTQAIGLRTDPDFLGSMVLVLGTLGSKILTGLEHLEFLASAREGGFKMLVELWNSGLWWMVGAVGVLWAFVRIGRRKESHDTRPTWGLVAACTVIGAVFASLLTVQFSGVVPKVLTSASYTAGEGPHGPIFTGCSGTIDGAELQAFKKDYKIALVCALRDPNVDQLSDKRISVSEPFEILSGLIPISAPNSPSGAFLLSAPTITFEYLPILVPRGVKWEKLTTLGDILQLGGKVLDPRYY
jgi:hypothetical protein